MSVRTNTVSGISYERAMSQIREGLALVDDEFWLKDHRDQTKNTATEKASPLMIEVGLGALMENMTRGDRANISDSSAAVQAIYAAMKRAAGDG